MLDCNVIGIKSYQLISYIYIHNVAIKSHNALEDLDVIEK